MCLYLELLEHVLRVLLPQAQHLIACHHTTSKEDSEVSNGSKEQV
jgi:hypothetical protein